ncbi:MAG: hypothetical protein H6958_10425 [Chromatiaceae bacterium]|nr:hypothetical protein [Chromatiaceae bacterium]
MTSNLPPGYVALANVAVHMATLRRFTRDPDRFLRMAPTAERLTPMDPASDEARAIYRDAAMAGDLFDLALTLREYSELETAIADGLRFDNPCSQPPIYLRITEAAE